MSSSQYAEFVLEQLASLRDVVTKRFFGGTGLSMAGTQFGFVMRSALYFVVDDRTRPKYEQMGSKCFSYDTKKKRVDVRKYYAVPAGLIEDTELLIELAREAINVAATPVTLKQTSNRTASKTKTQSAKRKTRRKSSKR